MRSQHPCNLEGDLRLRTLCAAVLTSVTALASAEDVSTVEDFDSPEYKAQLDPAWGVSPTSTSPEIHPPGRTFGGVDLGVPLWMGDNVDRDLIRPGVNLHLQGGIDLGYVAFFAHGGFRWVPVDFDRAADADHPEYQGEGRDPLKNPYFGLGVRGQYPNRSRLMPYLSGSFDFNFWHFRDTAVACGGYYYWWCGGYDVYEFAPGFSGRAGLAVYLAQCLYVDIGMGVSMSFEGDFFSDNQTWIEPFTGLSCRR